MVGGDALTAVVLRDLAAPVGKGAAQVTELQVQPAGGQARQAIVLQADARGGDRVVWPVEPRVRGAWPLVGGERADVRV